jgi:hypothetical protein
MLDYYSVATTFLQISAELKYKFSQKPFWWSHKYFAYMSIIIKHTYCQNLRVECNSFGFIQIIILMKWQIQEQFIRSKSLRREQGTWGISGISYFTLRRTRHDSKKSLENLILNQRSKEKYLAVSQLGHLLCFTKDKK